MTPVTKSFAVFCMAALLSGCQQLLPIGSEPERTFSLEYAAPLSVPAPNAPLVFLTDPLMAEGLGGISITVSLDSGERTALKGARWSTDLGSLVRDYLDRSLTATTGAQFVGEGSLDLRTRCRLQTKVWVFDLAPGADAAQDRARVSIEMRIIDNLTGTQIARDQARSEKRIAGNDPADVVEGLTAALSDVSQSAAALVNDQLEACSSL